MRQEGPRPWLVFRAGRLGLMARGHAEQVVDPHLLEVVARFGRCGIGEELQHLVVQAELALGDGQPDRGRGEALAQ